MEIALTSHKDQLLYLHRRIHVFRRVIQINRCQNVFKFVFRRNRRIINVQVVLFVVISPEVVVDHVLVVMRELHDADS